MPLAGDSEHLTMRPDANSELLLPPDMTGQTAAATTGAAAEFLAGNMSLLFLNASGGNETTAQPANEDFYNRAQFVTGLICYPIICLFGLTGNIFILIVMAQKAMATSTNVFLSALAVSDIIKLVNDVLYFLTVLLYKLHVPSGNKCYGYLYPYAHFIFNMCVCTSSWLTVAVAAERYVLVCHPALAKGMVSIRRSKIICIGVYILMTSVAIPSALRYRTTYSLRTDQYGTNYTWLDVELTSLWRHTTFTTAYTWVQSLLRSILPLFVLVITSGFIINALRKTRANKKLASRNKITIMLIVVIVFFLVCIIPDAVMSAFFNFGYTESEDFQVKGVREVTDMLLGVNAAINFALYIIFNKVFRDQFCSLFCKRCQVWCKKADGKSEEYQRLPDAKPATNGVRAPSGGAAKSGESVM